MCMNISTRTYNVNVDLPLPYFGEFVHKGRTIRNNLGWGNNSQKKIPARETCLKKILRIVISKKKNIAEEA